MGRWDIDMGVDCAGSISGRGKLDGESAGAPIVQEVLERLPEKSQSWNLQSRMQSSEIDSATIT